MTETQGSSTRLSYLVVMHGMIVLFVGLLSGIMLIFSLLDAVALWPFPALEVAIPGSTRGWQAAHVGGILNGVMIAVGGMLMTYLGLSGKRANWVGWGLIITGWANTLFYWAGNFSTNRGLSVGATPYGEGDLAGALAFLGGGAGMAFTFIAVVILAIAALERSKVS